MLTYVIYAIKTFSALLIIMGPFSVIPIFISMTVEDSAEHKRRVIKKALLASTGICMVFAVLGTHFFSLFGITIDSFRIAGGLLLLLMSINMLQARHSAVRTTEAEHQEGVEKEDISVFPLAIPLITGPGTISTVVLLSGEAHGLIHHAIIIAAIAGAALTMYLILRLSNQIFRMVGNTGLNIMTRLMGLIMAAMSVEYILMGLTNALKLHR